MAPFGPVPAMVGNETSLSAPLSRRNVSSASTASISVSAPMRGRGARDLGCILDGLEQAHRIAAAHRLAACGNDQAAQGICGGGAVERDGGAGVCQLAQPWRQRVWLGDIGGLLEMVAGAVGQ